MTKWHGGKGSTRRPMTNTKQFDDNWDKIFGKKGNDEMSKEARLESLIVKHRELDEIINTLEVERAPDDIVKKKKVEKLKMKEEIESLQSAI